MRLPLGIALTVCAALALLPSRGFAHTRILPKDVTAKDVTFYSEEVACRATLYYPKDFDPAGKTPGVVLAPGWAETAAEIEPIAAQLAAHGLVAMAIDYRGWGKSGGFVRLAESIKQDDRLRYAPFTAKVRIKRGRLLPEAQIEDIRNAISFLQGEPGVDRERIGLFGQGYSAGYVISLAARDGRVKAGVCANPIIGGKDAPGPPFKLEGDALKDAILRARAGQGAASGVSTSIILDEESHHASAEYLPFLEIDRVPATTAILFLTSPRSDFHAPEASAALQAKGIPTKIDKTTDPSASAAQWFTEHLK